MYYLVSKWEMNSCFLRTGPKVSTSHFHRASSHDEEKNVQVTYQLTCFLFRVVYPVAVQWYLKIESGYFLLRPHALLRTSHQYDSTLNNLLI